MRRLAVRAAAAQAAGEPLILVTVARAQGSTPREAGAAMLVGPADLAGTIGGGRIEWEATLRARAMLADGGVRTTLDLPLGPEIGQCCGGRVTLALERLGAATLARLEAAARVEAEALPSLYVFGAGHVGRALVQALAPLPLCVRWIDERPEMLSGAPEGILPMVAPHPVALVADVPAGAAFFVLTHSHARDFELCEAVLRRADFAYLGLIGSRSKRRQFERGLLALGVAEEVVARLVCPIGAALRDKRPEVIAALATAEVLHALAAAPIPLPAAPGPASP